MRFLGPVFRYDLVRVARRQRLALWRFAYGFGLLVVLFVLYAAALPEAMFGGKVSKTDAAAFAQRFADVFMAVQFAVVIVITPALTANAVAEEKGQNTLIFLLSTHLSNHEILLGKLFTRLLQVGLLILTGLPVLALVQFMGGVYLPQIVAEYAALALTALSLGCLGLFCGVFVKKPQNAAWRAYQILVGFLALSFLSIWYFELPTGRAKTATAFFTGSGTPGPFVWTTGTLALGPPTLTPWEEFLSWANSPNPYFAYEQLGVLQSAGEPLDRALWTVFRVYAISHGGLSLLLGGLAVLRLRAVAAKQTSGVTHKKKLILRPVPHPPVRERPVLWKEVYCEARPRQRWLRVFFGRWFFAVSFLPGFFIIMLTIETSLGELVRDILFLLRYVGTFVVGLLCLRAGLHAARSIGGERDRQTLDSLLITQLTRAEIFRDKWWGSLLAGRWLFFWLLIHWSLALLPFALHPLSMAALVIETLVYAAFAVSLGMFFAVYCRTTRQALAATLLVGLLGTTLLPWAGGKVGNAFLPADWIATTQYPPNVYGWWDEPRMSWPELVSVGLTPPRVLAYTVVPWSRDNWYGYGYFEFEDPSRFVLPAAFGLGVYGLVAGALAVMASRRFRRSRGRASKAWNRAADCLSPEGAAVSSQGVRHA